MIITMKIAGVPADSIGLLHAELKKVENPRWISIQESKLNTSHNDYVVEIKIDPSEQRRVGQDVFTRYRPLPTLLSVLRAVDPALFPEEETDVPDATTAERLRYGKEDKLYNALFPDLEHLIGQTFYTHISEVSSGEILLPPNRKITRTLLWKLIKYIDRLDFGGNDEKIVPALQAAREKAESMSNRY